MTYYLKKETPPTPPNYHLYFGSNIAVRHIPLSKLSARNNNIKSLNPLVIYLFLRTKQPIMAWIGTSSRDGGQRLLEQKTERAIYDHVFYLELPDQAPYDRRFCEAVEHTAIFLAETRWPWCFLENKSRIIKHRIEKSGTARSLAENILSDASEFISEDQQDVQLNPLFAPVNSVIRNQCDHIVAMIGGSIPSCLLLRGSTVCLLNDDPLIYSTRESNPENNCYHDYSYFMQRGYLRYDKNAKYPLTVRLPIEFVTRGEAYSFVMGKKRHDIAYIEKI